MTVFADKIVFLQLLLISMTSLHDLIAQRDALEKQISDTKRAGREQGIAKINELMAEYGLTTADILGGKTSSKVQRAKSHVAAKYRNQQTGETWSGRGLKPKWLTAAMAQGKTAEDFSI